MRVHDSQAYRNMDVTRARTSRTSELKEILLSIQADFSLVNAAVCLGDVPVPSKNNYQLFNYMHSSLP